MKKTLLFSSMFILSTVAIAAQGVYVDGHIGGARQTLKNSKVNNEGSFAGQSATFNTNHGKRSGSGLAGGAAIGYNFNPEFSVPIRTELNYTVRERLNESSRRGTDPQQKHNVKMGMQTLMGNVWFDLPTGREIEPYIGGGLGYAHINYKGTTSYSGEGSVQHSRHKTKAAWGLGAGLNYTLDSNWSFDLGYRYIDAGKIKASSRMESGGALISSSERGKIKSSELLLTSRYTF